MIEAAGGYAGTYYYHFDALGSVVALSDADDDTVQVYGNPGTAYSFRGIGKSRDTIRISMDWVDTAGGGALRKSGDSIRISRHLVDIAVADRYADCMGNWGNWGRTPF